MSEFLGEIYHALLLVAGLGIEKATEVLTLDIFAESGEFAPMLQLANNVQDIVRPMAITICAICFLVQFLKLTMTMNILKWEYIAKVFVGLIFARVAMDAIPLLLRAIYTTAAHWTLALHTGSYESIVAIEVIEGVFEDLPMLQTFIFMGVMSFVVLSITLCCLSVQVMAYARMFELFFWIAMSPLACAFIPLDDNRIAKQFVFRFAGVATAGLAMLLCIRLYGVFVNIVLSPALGRSMEGGAGILLAVGSLLTTLMGVALLMGLTAKCGTWAKSLFDAS